MAGLPDGSTADPAPQKRRRPTAERSRMVAAPVVGMVGLGEMGLPMARRVLAQGYQLSFYARKQEVRSELVGLGGRDGQSLAGVANTSDIVIICVYDDAGVREVCLGPSGVISQMRAGSVLINHTTGDPATARSLNRHARVSKVNFLDAALSGGPADIGNGHLTLLIGGRPSVLRRVQPVLASYADPIIHVGRVGDGQWVKLVNNALFAANVALVAHAERLIGEVGIPLEPALKAISFGSGDSRALRTVAQMGGSQQLIERAGRFIEKDVSTVHAVAHNRRMSLGVLGQVASSVGGHE
jgi:3-hydroxyisobutyrate dehydrogenase-like beta-hydroxyacid dehydrogenase